ncbi:hypothetical protein K2173_010015 [Erythroxylum novogranatense]|uniref:Peptide N-acetyl-beta-D-glucosaminyl asparaginase amidase A N-terminal domain-containing protein n=1 Tax=Erythroxylum novogranatense TaxID=1862640 RepID=A0AAV8SRB4_9ROSI|nr:hypothetical protein K2173_010015 [Erythroxylum novogranatense]
MAVSSVHVLIVCVFLFLIHPLPSSANLQKTNKLLRSQLLEHTTGNIKPLNYTSPTVYFEVTKPIKIPKTKPCSYLVLQHDFGYTYGQPPVLANYTPPSHCPSQEFSKIIIEWKATSRGRQFDRIFGVWLGGVELLRSCTAEPRATGIVWTVRKDITRYYSLLLRKDKQELAVYLGNIVDKTYTGVYHVNITFHFYPTKDNFRYYNHKLNNLKMGSDSHADLILPISRKLPLYDGLWFEIENSSDTKSKDFKIPPNVYRAVLEVYVSFHETDESWYTNVPNDYILANNLTDTPGNGPFREVVVSIDGEIVGAIWPFTVIYTGGINPLLWRPITGIGSFNLPSYDVEITPFLGNILDSRFHKLEFSVTNALKVWYIDANLHLWLDDKRARTFGKLSMHESKPFALSLVSDFEGLNGKFVTSARRSIFSSGWVASSRGNITTTFYQHFGYNNYIKMGKNGDSQDVNQVISFNDSISFQKVSSYSQWMKSLKTFSFGTYSDNLDQQNGTLLLANVTLGFNEKKIFSSTDSGLVINFLNNHQDGQGVILVKDNLVVSGVGSTQQVYQYDDTNFCYSRNISSSNYVILYDKVKTSCNKYEQFHPDLNLHKLWPFETRRSSLAFEFPNNNEV